MKQGQGHPSGIYKRHDLIYRELLEDSTPHDSQIDAITQRVVDLLDQTAITEWTDEHWKAWNLILRERSKLRLSNKGQLQLTTEELKKLTNSDGR